MVFRQREEVAIVVVGAGPSGLSAANLLGARGVRALVVEREPALYPLPRAVHFDDEVYRIFQAMGLEREVSEISRPMLGMQLVDGEHRVIQEFQRDPAGGLHGHPEANLFDQPELEAVLRGGVARFPGVELLAGTEVEAIEPGRDDGPAPVRVTLRDRATNALSEVWAQAVLGCDGARSRVRAMVGTEIDDLRFEESWLVVDVRTPEPLRNWDGVQQVCDPRRPSTYVPVGRGRYRWEFMLMPGEVPAEMTSPALVQQWVAPWLRGVDAEKIEVLRRAVYTFHALVARRWRRGRVFLLGDAAHQTPPFLGQGMCAGVRDAANLVWKLALVLEGRADERILDSYESERRPHVRRVIEMAVVLGRVMMGGGGGLRDRVLGAIARTPWLERRFSRRIGPGLRPGPLVQPRRRRRDAAGFALPQPRVVTAAGDERRLDEVLGHGFALVACDADPAQGLTASERAFWDALGTRFVCVLERGAAPERCAPGTHVVVDASGTLRGWLARHRAAAALVRPDRSVLAAAPQPEPARWRAQLEAVGLRG